MNIENRQLWQQAAGDGDRNYVDICVRWGVILCGPGYLGAYNAETAAGLLKDGWTKRKVGIIQTFTENVKSGDLVVLRMGTKEVHAVGEVVGNYEWSGWFGDVDGWDVEHVRRVRWLWVAPMDQPQMFNTYALKQGDSTQPLGSHKVISWLKNLKVAPSKYRAVLPSIKFKEQPPERVSMEDIAEHMFDQGASSVSIARFTNEVDELVRNYKWYTKKPENRPSEHETVAYLVVPFLRALGWTPQKMAIEWGRMDVALFKDLPRSEETLACVVEVKNLGSSCLKGRLQAEGYVKKWGRTCNRFVLTDGLRYAVYEMVNGGFELMAYMNLNRRYDEYPIYGCKGIRAAIMAMTPEKISDPRAYAGEVAQEEEKQ